jgi:hypothetical protein
MTLQEQINAKVEECGRIAAAAWIQMDNPNISNRVSLARVRLLRKEAHQVYLDCIELKKQLDISVRTDIPSQHTLNP